MQRKEWKEGEGQSLSSLVQLLQFLRTASPGMCPLHATLHHMYSSDVRPEPGSITVMGHASAGLGKKPCRGGSKEQGQILLPSAVYLEERLTVSQSVSWAGQQSVRQSVRQAGRQTETHSLGFFSVADSHSSSGENSCRRTSNGRVVEQSTADMRVDFFCTHSQHEYIDAADICDSQTRTSGPIQIGRMGGSKYTEGGTNRND